jgi:hypothetical protein
LERLKVDGVAGLRRGEVLSIAISVVGTIHPEAATWFKRSFTAHDYRTGVAQAVSLLRGISFQAEGRGMTDSHTTGQSSNRPSLSEGLACPSALTNPISPTSAQLPASQARLLYQPPVDQRSRQFRVAQ